MDMGERIKFLRNKAGMSQEELGSKIGVKKAAINKYESGIVENLKRSTIARLAEVLDTTPAYLMGWEQKEPAKDGELEEIAQRIKNLPPEKRKYILDTLRFLQGE